MSSTSPLIIAAFALALSACAGPSSPADMPLGSICDDLGCNGDTDVRPADDMTMVYVPAGEFEMGNGPRAAAEALEMCNEYHGGCQESWFEGEQPAHSVTLDGFWIDRTEVTNSQYIQCVEAGVCEEPMPSNAYIHDAYYVNPEYADYPAYSVTWEQAGTYCAWAGARLPTEAEWEYAARGPESWQFPWGDEFDGSLLNYCDVNCEATHSADESVDDGYEDTSPVGSFPGGASWCGALDLAGNVWEWVADGAEMYTTESQTNPFELPTGGYRIVRGGGWRASRVYHRSAIRGGVDFDADYNYGFRCASSYSDAAEVNGG